MSKDDPKAWMPLYIGDWEADTRNLTAEEDGCYFRLVRWYWRNGPPLADDEELSRIVGMTLRQWLKVKPRLSRFFQIDGERWSHGRVERTKVEWSDRKKAAAERAKAAADRRWKKDAPSNAPRMPQALLEECPSTSTSSATLNGPAAQLSASGQTRVFSNSEIRAKAVERLGPEWVISWLDPCIWQDLPTPMIVARSDFAAQTVRSALRPILAGVSVEARKRGAA